VFVFDTRSFFGATTDFSRSIPALGLPKVSPRRAQFLVEAVADLRSRLESRGSTLHVAVGKSEVELAAMARRFSATSVLCHRAESTEEEELHGVVGSALAKEGSRGGGAGATLEAFWGNTMYHIDDLPMDPSKDLPPVYTRFRQMVENKSQVRAPLPIPSPLKPVPVGSSDGDTAGAGAGAGAGGESQEAQDEAAGAAAEGGEGDGDESKASSSASDNGEIPSLLRLGVIDADADEATLAAKVGIDGRAVLAFKGGETEALARLQYYLFDSDLLKTYKETRNGMIGGDYSGKFSPWLALGCLSPRLIHAEVRRYERERVENKSTYWMLFELIWRGKAAQEGGLDAHGVGWERGGDRRQRMRGR
jgi:deoxyribodipyrimidine photo-lyase